MSHTLRQLLALFDARERRRWLALLPLSLGSALLEAVAALAVFALVRVLAAPGEPAPASGLLAALGLPAAEPAGPRAVTLLGVGVAGLFLAKNALRAAEAVARERCAARAAVGLSRRLLEAYLEAPADWLARRHSADLVRNVSEAVDRVCRAATNALAAVAELGVLAAVAAAVVWAVPGPALLALTATAALAGGVLLALQRRYGRWGEVLHEQWAVALKALGEAFGAVRELRLLRAERFAADRYVRARTAVARVQARREAMDAAPYLVLETLLVAGVAFVAAASAGAGREPLVLIGTFAYAVLRVLPAAHRLVYYGNALRFDAGAIAALAADEAALARRRPPRAEGAGDEAPRAPFERVVFEGVGYVHAPGEGEPALCDLDLEIRRGEWLAVVGASGAGKSTFVDLLLGFVEPTRGRIRVDGADLRDVVGRWQRGIGFVPQDVFLLDDSVRRNVALGVPDAEVDGAALARAVALAGLGPVLDRLPGGLDAALGERGVRLSGGERQRVAIARALYRRPALLVLDEATSALDGAAEAALAAALAGLRGEHTIVTVAHRAGLVERADRVAWLERGRLRAVGPWPEIAAGAPALARGLARGLTPPAETSSDGASPLPLRSRSRGA